jgi:dTDP-4-amino-4,6-dideoxygalactose transaminase
MNDFEIKLSHPFFSDTDYQFINDFLGNANLVKQNFELDKFESKLASVNKVKNVVAVSSGTSAIHLALLSIGIMPGDKVIVPTLTFAATAFPIKYVGAEPIFIDVEDSSWMLNINTLEQYLSKNNNVNLPKAIIAVDLFGRTCEYDRLNTIAERFNIPIIVDAAESLGSLYRNEPTVTKGLISILSFNFNKIITTTGGGAILTSDESLANKCRKLANQSRENVHWFEHNEIGYNYRLSPILAALGSSQIERLNEIISDRRKIRQRYMDNLQGYSGIEIVQDSTWEHSNAWLTNIRFNKNKFPNGREIVRSKLAKNGIESRFIWKPLHLQPVFEKSESIIDGTAEGIYNQSLCLPSGTKLELPQVDDICEQILSSLSLK